MAGGKGAKGGNLLQQSARWIHQRYQAPQCGHRGRFAPVRSARLGGNRRKLPEETLPWEAIRSSPLPMHSVQVAWELLQCSTNETTQGDRMEIGVFIPIGNNGWLISSTSPQYTPSFDLNREVVLRAERYGFDFALSMIKLRGFGGKIGRAHV